MKESIPHLRNIGSGNFLLIAGPWVMEGKALCFDIVKTISDLAHRLQIPYIFKAFFRKANCTLYDSFTGMGNKKALEIMQEVGSKFSMPTLADILSAARADGIFLETHPNPDKALSDGGTMLRVD